VGQDTEATEKANPRHVAIIMDGNGRWAKERGLPRNEGHRAGVRNVERIVDASRELNLPYLTLYAFSAENWNRPKLEVEALMRLLEQFLKSQRRNLLKNGVRLRVLGRLAEMPTRVRKQLERTLEETEQFKDWNLSLCLNYGSRTEVVDAVKSYAVAVKNGELDPEKISWEAFAKHLYTADLPDPDLVIRTSGELRISNFLLLQSAYAEYLFPKKYWPDFGPEDLADALDNFRGRERRFGLTGEQVQTEKVTFS
jgi:undecaprenyl diphosphate synthase